MANEDRRSLGCQLIVDGASMMICSAIRAWDAHCIPDHPLTSPQIHCCHWNLTRSKRGLGGGGELDFFWNSRLPAGRDQSGGAGSPKECYYLFKSSLDCGEHGAFEKSTAYPCQPSMTIRCGPPPLQGLWGMMVKSCLLLGSTKMNARAMPTRPDDSAKNRRTHVA
jgi:hypothetical protein